MTRYRLWQKANALHPTLSQSAVYEYLRGTRDIVATSAEALMAAAGIKFSGTKPAARMPKVKPAGKAKARKRSLVRSGVD
jgi:hypothetical protein